MIDGAWLSYSLQDLLMFGPEVFLRLFVRSNQDAEGWLWLAMLWALVVPVLMASRQRWSRVVALMLVAAGYGLSGCWFLLGYYAAINSPVTIFGWAFLFQGCGLAAYVAVHCRRLEVTWSAGQSAGWLVCVLILPLVTAIEAGAWRAVALFGLSPDTTVTASVLVLASLSGAVRWLALLLPLAWTLFAALTYGVLQLWWLMLFPLATLAMLGLGLSPRPGRSRG